MTETSEIKLSKMASGGGCGCKLPPDLLRDLLARAGVVGGGADDSPAALLVGAGTADDAAAWRLDDNTALLATTDFFSPPVDDPRDFGRIAAANALSDIYAMGGAPLFALALAGMPRGKLPAAAIAAVFAGGREMCAAAGAALAGGHSIDAPEPFYGLAVVGRVRPRRLMTNARARPGDVLLLGKPLGVGVLCAAFRRGELAAAEYKNELLATTLSLNKAGGDLANLDGAGALTDVTGFGLLGHLAEICAASNCGAEIEFSRLPLLPAAVRYAKAGITTGGAGRNWQSVSGRVELRGDFSDWQKTLLTDPQTSGGLLLSCRPESAAEAKEIFATHNQPPNQIGKITDGEKIAVT